MVELVGIEPPQWIENIQLADSTMSSNDRKGTNSNSAVQNGTRNSHLCARAQKITAPANTLFTSISVERARLR
jgi:hypothetical protein